MGRKSSVVAASHGWAVFKQEVIERNVHWNEDIGEWQLKCVAYTGNNMRKRSPSGGGADGDRDGADDGDLNHVYLVRVG